MKKLLNILRGMGSVLSIWPSNEPYKFDVAFLDRSDEEAIRCDWERVGECLQHAFDLEVNS